MQGTRARHLWHFFSDRKDLQLAECPHSCPERPTAGNAVKANANTGVLTQHDNQTSTAL